MTSDFTKCADELCPLREKCWRFMMPTAVMQSWALFERTGDSCEWFVENKIEKRAAEILGEMGK